jgi:putative ABC transport system permease protein
MLRRAVLASGLVVGLTTSLVCVVTAIGLVGVARGWLERTTYSPMPRLDVHLLDLALVVAVGTGTALAAAAVPALQAGRLDVVAALAGRRGQAAPRRRVAVVGLALVGTGLVTAVYAANEHSPFLVALGLALGEFGLVALSGTLIALAARVAPRLPLASRLALRDAARQRGRTAPAVAAVLAVVAGCSAVAVYAASQERHDAAGYRQSAALGTVYAWVDRAGADDVEASIRATMPVAELRRLAQPELKDIAMIDVGDGTDLSNGERRFLEGPGTVYVDDGAGLAVLLGRDIPAVRAELAAGRAVVFNRRQLAADGTVHLRVLRSDEGAASDENGVQILPGRLVRVPASYVELPLAPSQAVLPPSAVPLLGKEARAVPSLIVASTTRTPTEAEEQRLEARVADGAVVGVERGYQSPYPLFLLVILIASVVVALGSTLAVVGLSAAEGRADVATLAAVGAAPRVRRRLAAAQAGVVAVLGTVLGCISGIVSGATLVLLSRDRMREVLPDGMEVESWQVVLPWRDLGLLAVALPVLAVVTAALLTRSRLPMVRRLGQ